ncbi:hypothetical protein KKF55_04900 [Patescibacteria group bacterium]|nr:hypothetical protein [Patescibacteria group bacterium]
MSENPYQDELSANIQQLIGAIKETEGKGSIGGSLNRGLTVGMITESDEVDTRQAQLIDQFYALFNSKVQDPEAQMAIIDAVRNSTLSEQLQFMLAGPF